MVLSVSRIEARSEQFDMHMLLDVNTDIYPLQVDDKFTMGLASTLSLDGTPDDGTFDQVSHNYYSFQCVDIKLKEIIGTMYYITLLIWYIMIGGTKEHRETRGGRVLEFKYCSQERKRVKSPLEHLRNKNA